MNKKVVNQEPTPEGESFTGLLAELANNLAAVVHDEIELVIQGVREKVRAVRSGVFTLAIGSVILFAAFLSLCAAVIIGLTYFLVPVMAALVTGAGLALIGFIVAFIGYKQLKKSIFKHKR